MCVCVCMCEFVVMLNRCLRILLTFIFWSVNMYANTQTQRERAATFAEWTIVTFDFGFDVKCNFYALIHAANTIRCMIRRNIFSTSEIKEKARGIAKKKTSNKTSNSLFSFSCFSVFYTSVSISLSLLSFSLLFVHCTFCNNSHSQVELKAIQFLLDVIHSAYSRALSAS